MNPVYYEMVPEGQFHSGVPVYPTHPQYKVVPAPQPATYYAGQNLLYQQVQQVPVPQHYSFPSAPLHYQQTPANVSQFNAMQHRASPSPPPRPLDCLKVISPPMPVPSPPLPARIVPYNPTIPPHPLSKPPEEIGSRPGNDNITRVDELKTDFRWLALQHGIDVRSPLDNIDTKSQTECKKTKQNIPEYVTVKSCIKQQVLKDYDSMYGSSTDIKQSEGKNIEAVNTDNIGEGLHDVDQTEKETSYKFVPTEELEDEMSDEDSFEIEIEEHEILCGHYESSSWTESDSESNDDEEEVNRVTDTITRDNTDGLDSNKGDSTDYLDKNTTFQVQESTIKSEQLPVEVLASAIVKEAVTEALSTLANETQTDSNGESIDELSGIDESQNVSNNCSRDTRINSKPERKTRLYSWAYTEIHKKDPQKTDIMMDGLDESIAEPDHNVEIPENVQKVEVSEEMIQRSSSQGAPHCGVATSSNDQKCEIRYDDSTKRFCEKETWLNDTPSHEVHQRSCIKESNSDFCQSFDLKMIFKHKEICRSQSEGSESDMQSLEGSQSDPMEAFKMKASKRGIRIMNPAERLGSVTDSDADSDLKPIGISRSNTMESLASDFKPDPISRSSTIESFTEHSTSAQQSIGNQLNPDVPEFRMDYSLETNLTKLESVPDSPTISKNLPLNPNSAIFQPKFDKQNSDSLVEKKPADQSFRNYEPSQPWDTNIRVDAAVFVPGAKKDIKKLKAGIFYLPTPEASKEVDLSVAVQASPTVTSTGVGTKRVKLKDSTMCTSSCDTREVAINTDGKEEIGHGLVILPRKAKIVSKSKSTDDVSKRSVGVNVRIKDQAKQIKRRDASTIVDTSYCEPDMDMQNLLGKVKSLQLELMKYKAKEVTDQLAQQKETLDKQSEDLMKFFQDSDEMDLIRGLIINKISTIEKTITMVEVESLRTILKINSGKIFDVLPDLNKYLIQDDKLQSTDTSFNSPAYAGTSPIKTSPRQVSRLSSKAGSLAESPERMVLPIKASPRQVSGLSSKAGSLTQSPERMVFPFKASARLSPEARRLAESTGRNRHISIDGQRGNASHILVSPFQNHGFEFGQTQETVISTSCLSSKLSSPHSNSHASPLRLPVEPENIQNSQQLKSWQVEEVSDQNFQTSQTDKHMELKTEEKEPNKWFENNDTKKDTDVEKDLLSKLMRAEYSQHGNGAALDKSKSASKSMDSTELDEDLGTGYSDRHDSVGADKKMSYDRITELDTFDINSDSSEEMSADEVLHSCSLVQTESQNFMNKISNNNMSELDTFDLVSDDSDKIDADELMNKPQNPSEKISHTRISELDVYDTVSDDTDRTDNDKDIHNDSLELDEPKNVVVKNKGEMNSLKHTELDIGGETQTLKSFSGEENTDGNEGIVDKNEEKQERSDIKSTSLPDKQADEPSVSDQSQPIGDTKGMFMYPSSTSQNIQHQGSDMKLKSAASNVITGPVDCPNPCPISTIGQFDPVLFQAVMAQLIHAYPHLATNQAMLTSVAMQQTQILQMYMKGQQDVGLSVAHHPNFVNSSIGIDTTSPNVTLAADLNLQSAILPVNSLLDNKPSDKEVPVVSTNRSVSALTGCDSLELTTSASPTHNSSVKNVSTSQGPSHCDKENMDISYTTASFKPSPTRCIETPGIDSDFTDGNGLTELSVKNTIASSDMYNKICSTERTMSVYQSDVYRPKVSKQETAWGDSTQRPSSEVGMKTDSFSLFPLEQNKNHTDSFPKFNGKGYEGNKEQNVTMTHQDEEVISKTKPSNINKVNWRIPIHSNHDEHDGNLPSKRLASSIRSETQAITKSRQSVAANLSWGTPSPPEHDTNNGSFFFKKFGSSVHSEKQETTKKDTKMTEVPPRFRKKSQEGNQEQKQYYIPPHLRGQNKKDKTSTLIPSTEDWDTEMEDISETFTPKPVPAAKHGMKRKQDPSYEEKEDTNEKIAVTTEANSGGSSEMCDIPIPKVPKVDNSKEEAAEEEEEDEEEWCMVTTKKKKSQVKDQPIKKVLPPSISSTHHQKLSNFERLICRLQEEFPNSDRKAVIDAVAKVRKQRGSLSGLSLENIIERAQFFIEKKPNRYIPGLHIPQSTSGPKNVMNIPRMKPDSIIKNIPVLSDDDEDICVICHEALSAMETKELECLHTYHYKCISQWVERERTCPTCRQHALFPEDFPRLGK